MFEIMNLDYDSACKQIFKIQKTFKGQQNLF